jgi:hypothetical protein
MRKTVGYLGVALLIAVFIAGFVAYMIVSFDPATGAYFDGFGRRLTDAPLIARLIFAEESDSWPGWGWFIADMVFFWTGVGVGAMLIQYGFRSPGQSQFPHKGQATPTANEILDGMGLPPVGVRVTVTQGKATWNGVVIDAFSVTNEPLGITDTGIIIRKDDGTRFEAFSVEIERYGYKIVPEG